MLTSVCVYIYILIIKLKGIWEVEKKNYLWILRQSYANFGINKFMITFDTWIYGKAG